MNKDIDKKKTFYLRIKPELLMLANSCQERSVLLAMLGHCDNGNGVCFASLTTLGREAMVRKKTVAAAIETTGIFECTSERSTRGGYVKEWRVKRKYRYLIVHRPKNNSILDSNRFPNDCSVIEPKVVPEDMEKQLLLETIINTEEQKSQAQDCFPTPVGAPIVTFIPNKVEEANQSQANSCLPILSPDPKANDNFLFKDWQTFKEESLKKHKAALLHLSPEQRDSLRRREAIQKKYKHLH